MSDRPHLEGCKEMGMLRRKLWNVNGNESRLDVIKRKKRMY